MYKFQWWLGVPGNSSVWCAILNLSWIGGILSELPMLWWHPYLISATCCMWGYHWQREGNYYWNHMQVRQCFWKLAEWSMSPMCYICYICLPVEFSTQFIKYWWLSLKPLHGLKGPCEYLKDYLVHHAPASPLRPSGFTTCRNMVGGGPKRRPSLRW